MVAKLFAVALLVSTCEAFIAPVCLPQQNTHARGLQTMPALFMSAVSRRDALRWIGTASTFQMLPADAAEEEGGAWAAHESAFKDSEFADFKTTGSGLKYKDVVDGSGDQPKQGETVRAHYSGYLLDGSLFDTSYRPALFPFSLISPSGPPQAFRLEKGALIPGFEEGMLGMKVGGKRIIYVEPKLGYGERGAGSLIPPNSPLVFYLELRSIGSKLSL